MARKVIKTAKGPSEIKPQKESVWICMCGLSKNQPFCDGAHQKVINEPKKRIFEYDAEGHRKESNYNFLMLIEFYGQECQNSIPKCNILLFD